MATHSNALPRDYVLGEYHLVSVLGEGGFGITYQAEDDTLGCGVAIKEFLPVQLARRRDDGTVVSLSEAHAESFVDWKRRFLAEARTLARFRHRNIVRVLRFFEANNTAYLVMDLEQGITLEQYLASLHRPPTQGELDGLVLPVLDGLAAMHDGGFLHRDLKPQNIILRTDGTPVLIDFGAARQTPDGLTHTLTSIYTPGYAAPEQYAEHGRLGPWTDIFGMGSVLYRAISGARPMDAPSRLIPGADPLPPAAAVARERYRPPFLAGIDAALRIKPEDRPQSVAAWRDGLLAAAPLELAVTDGGTLVSHDASGWGAPPPAPPPPPPPPAPAVTLAEESAADRVEASPDAAAPLAARRSLAWVAAALGGVLLLAVAGLWLALRPADDSPAPPAAATVRAVAPAASEDASSPAAASTAAATTTATTTAPVLRDCPDCPDLVVIPAGSFVMGSPDDEAGRRDREGPQQTITLARPLAFARLPVTRGQYEAFVQDSGHGGTGCSVYRRGGWASDAKADWRSPGFEQDGSHPVVCVSFADAQAYVAWLSRKTGKTYRLPSEAEWEYAARAGSTTPRHWSDEPLCRHANIADASTRPLHPHLTAADCSDGFPYTAPAGSFPANGFGLHDMMGNVLAWTQDCWSANLSGIPKDGSARDGRCGRRVVRGTGWTDGPDDLRAAVRYNVEVQRREVTIGLRVVRADD